MVAINPKEAREIFYPHGAGGRRVRDPSTVLRTLTVTSLPQLEELEHKARRQDVLVDEREIFDFYDALIPNDICNGAAFEKWRRTGGAG